MSQALNNFAAEFYKEFGQKSAEDVVRYWIDTDYPPLNELISGSHDKGIPGARIVEIHGGSSSGKTWLTCQLMKATQKMGGVAIFCDQEKSLDINLAKRDGLSDAFPQFIYVSEETWEDYCDKALGMCIKIRDAKVIPEDKPIMVVMDSIASMVPKSMLYDGKGNRRTFKDLNMNDTTALPRVASSTLKILNTEFSRLNVTLVLINQVRTKPGVMYGDPTYTPGGEAFAFYPSVRLQTGRKLVKDKKTGDVSGQLIGIKTVKNKMHQPFKEIEVLLEFPPEGGAYFNREMGLIQGCITKGKLKMAGAWVEGWPDGKKYHAVSLAEKVRAEGLYQDLVNLYVGA